jgi:hypothetical protein
MLYRKTKSMSGGMKKKFSTYIKGTLHTNKRGNTPKGNNSYQLICTQCQCTQFHQTYSKGHKNIHRLQHRDSGGF